MLDPFSRGAIVAMTALCVAGAVSLAPIRARSSIEGTQLPSARLVDRTPSDAVPIVPIMRDPFAAPVSRSTPVQSTTALMHQVAGLPARPAELGALPSNLANDVIPALPASAATTVAGTPRITAIVTGARSHPYAMIETGEVHEIKGIGDRIGGVAIVSIDLDGIRLQNGERLSVASAAGSR